MVDVQRSIEVTAGANNILIVLIVLCLNLYRSFPSDDY